MSLGAGFATKTAFRREGNQGAYGTPVQCGSGHQMPLIPGEDLLREIVKDMDNQAQYGSGCGESEILAKIVSGPAIFTMAYRGLEYLILCALGWAHSPETVAGGVYKHLITPANNLHTEHIEAGDAILPGDGWLAGDKKVRRGTLCIDKIVSVWEFISVMINAITIRGNSRGIWLDCELIPYNLDRASSTNTSSSGWTIPNGDWEPVLFQDLVFWIGDYSVSTPLSSSNAVGITGFEIKIENNLEITQDSQSGLYIAEPRREGKRRVTGTFTVPRYETDTFLDKLDAQTATMAMMQFTGPEIGATGYYYTFWIWLPTIRFDQISASVESPGIIPVTYAFTAEIPGAVPSGFPCYADKEIAIQLQNDNSNYLLTNS